MTSPVVLVVARAPVPGQAKTRLAASVGASAAAHLAAAALLDTMKACEIAFERCYLALSGDLDAAVGKAAITEQSRRWRLLPQRGARLSERLTNAHCDVGAAARAAVVQIGMDTPHVQPEMLGDIAEALQTQPAVLGPAEDGGWWVLGLQDHRAGRALTNVPMSTPETGELTRAALERLGVAVAATSTMRDVDTADDAAAVAAAAPHTGFAALWHSVAIRAEALR